MYVTLENKNFTFDFVYLFLIVLGINIILLIATYFFFDKPIFEDSDLTYLSLKTFVMYIIVIPLIEEFCFRGMLMLPKTSYFIYPTIFCIVIVLFFYFKFNNYTILLGSCLIVIGLFYLISSSFQDSVNLFIEKYPFEIIVMSAILFALLHGYNYESNDIETYIKLIPRLSGGLYLGYIAYKYGISESYTMHAINNVLPFIYLVSMKVYLRHLF